MTSIAAAITDVQIRIDGKVLRGSGDVSQGKSPLHLVSAWVGEVNLILGQVKTDATESFLRDQAAGQSIIHIAAHAELTPDIPMLSTIHLGEDDQHDGRLKVREIYSLDLSAAQLVVLSGCETGSGRGDDFGLLNQAFFTAGAQRVVSSLWSVDDAATAELLTAYFDARETATTEADALRAAMLATREQYPDPYFWASFIITGQP